MQLNQKQKERLYLIYDFEDYEEIINAWLYGEELTIEFLNHKDNTISTYKPNISEKEDKEKIEFIIYGVRLNRNEYLYVI